MSTEALALLALLTLSNIGAGWLLYRLGVMLATWRNLRVYPGQEERAKAPMNGHAGCAGSIDTVAKRQMDKNATTNGTH